VSFVLILLLGRRLPRHGSEIGVAALGASFLLTCGVVYQWIDRIRDADAAEGETEHALGFLGAMGRSLGLARPLQEEGGEHALPAVVEPITRSFTWLQNGGIRITTGMQIDGLAVMMLFVVTAISLLVHVYSLEYMKGDRRFTHYYAFLSLFTASMLTLVVADNTLMLLIGWELVGLCSFVLIGHWWEDKPNSDAAVKAFLTTRTGDIGLMIGIIILFFATGTFNIVETNQQALAGDISHGMLLAASCTLLLGIIGKSGQFPLHTWLPDAMAGPTPVSALIHAATMVVAGIYLGARLYGVFWEGFSIADGGLNLMALIGAITVVIGALLAFVQSDIKKVLAYSTISQLGYMVMGLGVGAWIAALFHLFTHAFFKALLFLGAGSVSHSGAHHSFDMKADMGGLRKYMPQTFATFVIGSLALAGIFPLAGFWSKDEILATAGQGEFELFMWVGLIGAFLTAAYMTRCIWYTFFGEYRGGDAHAHADAVHAQGDELVEHHLAEVQEPDHVDAAAAHGGGVAVAHAHDDHAGAHEEPHESPRLITMPLWILAVASVLAGFLNATAFEIELFQEWVEPRIAYPLEEIFHPEFELGEALLALAVALGGIGVSYLYYWRGIGLVDFAKRNALARAGKTFLEKKYYLDVLYTDIIVGSIKGPIARAAYWFNQNVIDNVLNYTGRGAVVAATATYKYLDQAVIDQAYDGLAVGTGEVGQATRRVQNGRLQWYALVLVMGVLLLALAITIAS
jgi:NADH-quinone oxidoreductase subunit L